MTTQPATPANDKPKTRELLRFGLGAKPVSLAKLLAHLDLEKPGPDATIRVYNGSAIIEEPSPEVEDE